MQQQIILDNYSKDAEDLISRFERLSTTEILAQVQDTLPSRPCRVLDVGAGTGRDASWFAAQGHKVVAVEPVPELRRAGTQLHSSDRITWLDDRLPGLESMKSRRDRFDLILVIAVWQHLSPDQQGPALHTVASLLAQKGRLIISVRHGPGPPDRPCFPCSVEQMVEWGSDAGLSIVRQVDADSIQLKNRQAGVTWTWLCFERL